MGDSLPQYEYTAYIDEAGDEGLVRVKPADANGSSEWFVLAATIVSRSKEAEVIEMVRGLHRSIGSRQKRDIHFRDLLEHNKQLVCGAISKAPLRNVVVLSHKPNMRGYRNERVEPMANRSFFYCWMTRLLMERVTDLCSRNLAHRRLPPSPVRFVFSRSRGVSYPQMRAYLDYLRDQSRNNHLYISRGDISWSVYDRRLVLSEPHTEVAGLQVVDSVASSFFQALEPTPSGKLRQVPAKLLQPTLGSRNGKVWDYGLKLMPRPELAKLDNDRLQFLLSFG